MWLCAWPSSVIAGGESMSGVELIQCCAIEKLSADDAGHANYSITSEAAALLATTPAEPAVRAVAIEADLAA